MKVKLTLLLLSCLSVVFNLSAQVNKDYFDVKGTVITRALYLPGSDQTKGEANVTIKLISDVNGLFKVVAIAGTGDGFIDSWDTFVGDDDGYQPTINLRNLYIEKTFAEIYKVQFGALNPEEGILRSGGFWSTGWIDGLRAKAETSMGTVSVTLGSLGDLDEPSIFSRDTELNYAEIKVSKKFFETLLLEAAYENLNEVHYAKFGANYDFEIASDRVVKLILEYISSSEGGYKSVVGVESDFYKLITGRGSDVKIRLSWQHVDEDFDLSKRPATSFWTQPGDTLMVEASGPIKKEWDLSWYAQFRINESVDKSYYIVGVKKGIDFNKLWNKGKSLFHK